MEILRKTYCLQSQSQAILPGLIQRLKDAGLAKAPRTPGLQDFLEITGMGRCTWDHLLWENFRNYKARKDKNQFFFSSRKNLNTSYLPKCAPGD
jgi:hypothetical protein